MIRPPGRLEGLLAGVALAALGAGCGIFAAPAPASAPPASLVPGATASLAGAGVRAQLVAALSARNLILADARVPFHPPEPPPLAAIPRSVYQVQLRDDPEHGFIVVYAFPSAELAAAGGRSMADYLATGPGRVQEPAGTVYVLRQLGSWLIAYHWLPAAAVDQEMPKIQEALETLGTEIPAAR
jgi:hypothetical protein